MNFRATQHLSTVDPVMRPLIYEMGPFALAPKIPISLSEPVEGEVTCQQLDDRAVESS
jgi:hypothetical protein